MRCVQIGGRRRGGGLENGEERRVWEKSSEERGKVDTRVVGNIREFYIFKH